MTHRSGLPRAPSIVMAGLGPAIRTMHATASAACIAASSAAMTPSRRRGGRPPFVVMAGLDPAIRRLIGISEVFLDSRLKCGHDSCNLSLRRDFSTRSSAGMTQRQSTVQCP